MKYIITWVLVTTFESNHSQYLVSSIKTIRQPQEESFTNRTLATTFFESKKNEIEAQYEMLGKTKVIPCPKCWEYLADAKIDSVKTK